jgi:hypothetical protein
MSSRFLEGLRREGALVVAGAVFGSAALAVGSAALLASACTDTLAQPDDAGPFVQYEGGHPPPSMYGSPCELEMNPPELCCGEVAKEIRADQCYGCTGKLAYALCAGGAFTCACTCEPPLGYSLLVPDGGGADCGSGAMDGAVADAVDETDAADAGAIDASGDASIDATADADGGPIADARDGG